MRINIKMEFEEDKIMRQQLEANLKHVHFIGDKERFLNSTEMTLLEKYEYVKKMIFGMRYPNIINRLKV